MEDPFHISIQEHQCPMLPQRCNVPNGSHRRSRHMRVIAHQWPIHRTPRCNTRLLPRRQHFPCRQHRAVASMTAQTNSRSRTNTSISISRCLRMTNRTTWSTLVSTSRKTATWITTPCGRAAPWLPTAQGTTMAILTPSTQTICGRFKMSQATVTSISR